MKLGSRVGVWTAWGQAGTRLVQVQTGGSVDVGAGNCQRCMGLGKASNVGAMLSGLCLHEFRSARAWDAVGTQGDLAGATFDWSHACGLEETTGNKDLLNRYMVRRLGTT